MTWNDRLWMILHGLTTAGVSTPFLVGSLKDQTTLTIYIIGLLFAVGCLVERVNSISNQRSNT